MAFDSRQEAPPREALLLRHFHSLLPHDPVQRAVCFFLWLTIVFSLVSIALAQILHAVVGLLSLWDRWRRRAGYRFPPLALPVAAFFVTSLLSLAFSPDPLEGLKPLKKFLLFLLMMFLYTYVTRREQVQFLYLSFFVGAAISAAAAIVQYYTLPDLNLLNRVHGFMSHYMTFAGQQMLAFVAMLAFVLFARGRGRFWGVPLMGITGLAILLALTRNAWLGAITAACVVLGLRKWQALWALPLVIAGIYTFLPEPFADRARSIVIANDLSSQIRIDMLHTSINMVKAHPWVGVGPNMVPRVVSQYRQENHIPEEAFIHLHSNFLQLAAERGLLCLAAWLWLVGKLLYDYVRMRRYREAWSPGGLYYTVMAAMGAVAALLSAGFFEFNFGDSEVMMVLLFLVTMPYVVKRIESSDPASGS